MVITSEELLQADASLCHIAQLRFTRAQYDLLEHVAASTGRKVGPLVRDVVTVWALRYEAAAGDVDVEALVAELQALGDVP
jgi:hypothetical protein